MRLLELNRFIDDLIVSERGCQVEDIRLVLSAPWQLVDEGGLCTRKPSRTKSCGAFTLRIPSLAPALL